MFRAIAIKELRETVGFAALALAVLAYFVHNLINSPSQARVPFVLDGFSSSVPFVLWGLAVVLGLRQSAWERIRGTYSFLLHRPATPRAIFAAKIITGIVLLQLVAAVPILWYGLWAATPNTHPGPFEWAMAESALCIWLGLPVVYLGAFLSGVRPARWWGTRLLPGAAASLIFLFLFAFGSWWVALVGSLAVSALLTMLVFHIAATSDFG